MLKTVIHETPEEYDELKRRAEAYPGLVDAGKAINEHLGHYIRTFEEQYPHSFSVVDMQEAHKKLLAALKQAKEL